MSEFIHPFETGGQAVVASNLLAMRSAPDSRAEMVSQAVYGSAVGIIDISGEYTRIQTEDGYEGWSFTDHLSALEHLDTELTECLVTAAIAPLYDNSDGPRRLINRLTMGSRLRIIGTNREVTVVKLIGRTSAANSPTHGTAEIASALVSELPKHGAAADCILESAYEFLGTPYVWGGTSAFGCDCSGFVQRVFDTHGIALPRDAYQQASSDQGARTSDAETPQKGDLVFFRGSTDPRNRGITHVGIALNGSRFIHASSRLGVSVSDFEEPAVKTEYTYRGGLRVLPGQPNEG